MVGIREQIPEMSPTCLMLIIFVNLLNYVPKYINVFDELNQF